MAHVQPFEARRLTERTRWDDLDFVLGQVDCCYVIWDHANDFREVSDVPVVAPHDVGRGEVPSAAFKAVTAAGRGVEQKQEQDGERHPDFSASLDCNEAQESKKSLRLKSQCIMRKLESNLTR